VLRPGLKFDPGVSAIHSNKLESDEFSDGSTFSLDRTTQVINQGICSLAHGRNRCHCSEKDSCLTYGSLVRETNPGLSIAMGIMQQVMENAAQAGSCVVVGRGAPYFFRDRKDAFHVFLFAPPDEKIRRLLQHGNSRAEAEEAVDTIDRERAAFIKHYFGKEWPNRYLYHLMINTTIGDDNVVSTILETMRTYEENQQAIGR